MTDNDSLKHAAQITANAFSVLQETKIALIGFGGECCDRGHTEVGKLIIAMGQLMDKGKDAMQPDFLELTMGRMPKE